MHKTIYSNWKNIIKLTLVISATVILSILRASPTVSAITSELSIEAEKNLSLTLSSSSIILDLQPTPAGNFSSTSMTVNVSTNNTTGYSLIMTADSTNLSRTSAVNGETPTIPTIPQSKTFTKDNFETGYWGYKVGTSSTDYLPMTTTSIPIASTAEPTNSNPTTIVFASKLDTSTPTGLYSGVTLSFLAITNEIPEPELLYSLVASEYKGKTNTAYAVYNFTHNGIDWSLDGNMNNGSGPWRLGYRTDGSGTQHSIYTLSPVSGNVTELQIEHDDSSVSSAVKAMSIAIYRSLEDVKSEENAIAIFEPTFTKDETMKIANDNTTPWLDCYYRINYLTSGSKNGSVRFNALYFYGFPSQSVSE